MPSLPNERAVLLRIAEHDQQAFVLLFDHYRPAIYATALRMTASSLQAEEVVQDVFLKIWLRRATLPAIENFPAYLHTMAENHIYSAFKSIHREKQHLQQLQQEGFAPTYQGTEDLLLAKEYEQVLQQAVAQLPAKQQQTYILIKQQGLKREEAAAILQVSSETVKWNLEEAMRKIRAFCLARLDLAIFFPFIFSS